MKLLVCGGRDFGIKDVEREFIRNTLDSLLPRPALVIAGGANGVDRAAQSWADFRGIPCMVFPAAWNGLNKAAGPIRNGWMLTFGKPDMVLAFPGGAGTANMVKLANDAGVKVVCAAEAWR